MSTQGLPLARATAVALVTGAALLAASLSLGWPDLAAAWAGLDFNAALFEDFLGPYWQTASALLDGRATPASGYVYPAFGAWILAPLSLLGDGAASWACAAIMAGAATLLLSSLFILRPPSSDMEAAAVGAAVLLAHPVVHGAYWGQAALPVAALSVAAFAAWHSRRPTLGGALIGIAAAIKLTPIVLLLAPALRRDRPTLLAGASAFVSCAVLLPLLLMGPAGFVAFHAEAAAQLGELASGASTGAGGRGSQDPGALLARLAGDQAYWAGKVAGVGLALLLLRAAIRELRSATPSWDRAFVLLAAAPWLMVTPTWPHGLVWVVVAWRAGLAGGRASRVLAAGSVVLGTLPLLRLLGDPVQHASLGIPAAAAALALGAAVTARRPPHGSAGDA